MLDLVEEVMWTTNNIMTSRRRDVPVFGHLYGIMTQKCEFSECLGKFYFPINGPNGLIFGQCGRYGQYREKNRRDLRFFDFYAVLWHIIGRNFS